MDTCDRRSVLRLFAGVAALPFVPRLARGGADEAWATGGTAAMTDKATYPDPFASPADACAPSRHHRRPCTTLTSSREDVSEGDRPAGPLALRVVDARTPPPGVTVKIWHTNIEGSYRARRRATAAC